MTSRRLRSGWLWLVLVLGGCGDDGEAARVGVGGAADGGGAVDAAAAPMDDAGTAEPARPFVMVVLDSSGSTERKRGCSCTSDLCEQCAPGCEAGETSLFIEQLEALTGSFTSGRCTALARTAENGATYDEGYALDYHRPPQGAQQRDGILDEVAAEVWLGTAVFDGVATYVGGAPLVSEAVFDREQSEGVSGLFSYGGTTAAGRVRSRPDGTYVGRLVYPTSPDTHAVDTGIRSASAADGALTASFTEDISDALQASLLATRPFGGSPVAAALDDLDAFFRGDEHARAFGGKRYVVLVTSGGFDDDYRSFGCDCNDDPDDPNYCGDGKDPDAMSCPYPLPVDAALRLRCGYGPVTSCERGQIEKLYVAGFADPARKSELDALAEAGGSERFRGAASVAELRQQLREVFDEITRTGR